MTKNQVTAGRCIWGAVWLFVSHSVPWCSLTAEEQRLSTRSHPLQSRQHPIRISGKASVNKSKFKVRVSEAKQLQETTAFYLFIFAKINAFIVIIEFKNSCWIKCRPNIWMTEWVRNCVSPYRKAKAFWCTAPNIEQKALEPRPHHYPLTYKHPRRMLPMCIWRQQN